MCTDQHATKETQKATPVHSITRTVWKSQPLPSRAEIDSITPGMTAISGDKGMKERHAKPLNHSIGASSPVHDGHHYIMYTIRHDMIAVMSVVKSKIGIFPYTNLEDDFMCTDLHATKKGQGATSVHSITRTRWKTQPFPSTAEIDSIASGMTAI